MATDLLTENNGMGAAFSRFARAEMPFNPLGGVDGSGLAIAGANVDRCKKAMEVNGWNDPRFISEEQMKLNGWSVPVGIDPVELQERNSENGKIEKFFFYNAQSIHGIPSLEAMVQMSDAEIKSLEGGVEMESFELEGVDSDELIISPGRELLVENGDTHFEMMQKFNANQRISENKNYLIIENNGYQLMPVPDDELDEADLAEIVAQDVAALENLAGMPERQFAMVVMGVNAQKQKGYKFALEKQSQELSWEVESAQETYFQQITDREIGPSNNSPDISEPEFSESSKQEVDVGQDGLSAGIGGDGSEIDVEKEVLPKKMMVMAPYWLNGLHNKEGIDVANQINKMISQNKIAEDEEAIQRLLSAQVKAQKLGLEVVDEQEYLKNREYKENRAEPKRLLGGELVRDKQGAYRYGSGGKPVLVDHGDALSLKSKGQDAYRGAMELALSKGWTAIELKGKPAMMAEAWLEAKMLNLNVVNYKPTEKDQEKLAERIAELKKQSAKDISKPIEQAPEMVEVRPYLDAEGHTKMAQVTYTVSYQGGQDVSFDNAKDAAGAFHSLDKKGASSPVVIRSVTRADGLVQDAVVAGVDIRARKGASGRTLERLKDRDFNEAMGEIVERVNAVESLDKENPSAKILDGEHVGAMLGIKDGYVLQSAGRGKVVWHDLAALKGVIPKQGEVFEIHYEKGVGKIKEKEHEIEGGRDRGR